MSANYQRAVNWAKGVLSCYVRDGQLVFPDFEPSEVYFRYALKIIWQERDGVGFYNYPPESLSFLVGQAGIDRGAFQLLGHICASHINMGEPVPEIARGFAALKMSGDLEVSHRQSRASKTFTQNLYLMVMVDRCEREFGLSRFRNDASPPNSCCDAIADALAHVGHHRTQRSIRDLFSNKSNANLRQMADQIRVKADEIMNENPELAREWMDRVLSFDARDGE